MRRCGPEHWAELQHDRPARREVLGTRAVVVADGTDASGGGGTVVTEDRGSDSIDGIRHVVFDVGESVRRHQDHLEAGCSRARVSGDDDFEISGTSSPGIVEEFERNLGAREIRILTAGQDLVRCRIEQEYVEIGGDTGPRLGVLEVDSDGAVLRHGESPAGIGADSRVEIVTLVVEGRFGHHRRRT